ncbi:MAG TPA: phosphotransferase [Steroidobacteraceae bacterium]|nr:phosphotransferase [Steroidobacteraceae bacterium]
MATDVEDFMATMVAPPRPVPLERALALVRESYGLEPQSTARLTGERDENFRLTAAGDAEYVLKIANPAENPAETDFQTAALLHVEETDPALPCPRVLRNRAGNTHIRFLDEGGAGRTARVLTFLPGRLLGASTRSRQQRAACGRIGARLTLALRDFEHPAARRTIVWDVRHTGHMRRLLEELPRFPYHGAARELLAKLTPTIESQLPRLRHQVVHGDLNPLNILVDPADEERVTGVIDFGDMTHTALIADVAVCAAELVPIDCADAGAARDAILDVAGAYHACVPLLRPELALLGALVAARLLQTLVIHEWHVQRNPASGHYQPLAEDFMRARLRIADRLLLEEMRL